MANRDSIVRVRFTPEELAMVREKMAQYGTDNLSAFVRKMCIDGYMVKLDFPELKEMVSLLRYSSNNLNQLTKRVHQTGRIYDADLEELHRNQDALWEVAKIVLNSLAKLD